MPRSKAEVKGCISSIVPRARVGPAAQQQPGHPPQAVLRRHHQRRGPLPVARVPAASAASTAAGRLCRTARKRLCTSWSRFEDEALSR
eukprot:CAMPEP_0206399252 /NCGR_PEP_ID=MMETSP0294-20121207/24708_1 /ASSEMBLY_ACC=CAM_ASM_000327 /TAXON_ID=39354 /ORGANISM="Heterosigma akashiwo, Strain CCMP2393" /LENGTH=87 /DNA_ID=CAMNT_0053855015 /DNA_START=289 /DNA_END=549 /DNA_ORIENTATION=+